MSDPTYPLTWPEALKAAKQGALIECSGWRIVSQDSREGMP